MFAAPRSFWKLLLLIPLLSNFAAGQDNSSDEEFEENARVARISVLIGDAKINRVDSQDWETVVENLPIVEGDTIATERNSKIELQLDRYNFLHLDGNSALKLIYFADDGVALSLSQGTLGVRLIRFDFENGYFEVDAPASTVTIQRNGGYRIDAGDEFNQEVRVSVRDNGQARVYSRDSGFVVRDGRTARLLLDEDLSGEWDISNASTLLDGFDSWLQSRNEHIARSLSREDDRDYYDDDVYGADDLDDYGRWIYTSTYGYIWRPDPSHTARYSNWSPYRYGQWRWLPYYGWTWVHDEPWGWATYHSGRWIFYRGAWYWSPYRGFRRPGSYWWRPALVFVTYVGNNYCWYPLPYGYGYYDYNRRFRDRWEWRKKRRAARRRGDRNQTPRTPVRDRRTRIRNQRTPIGRVPVGGVVSTPRTRFGTVRNGFERPPIGIARRVLDQEPEVVNSPPFLPDRRELDRKGGRDIVAPAPRIKVHSTNTGAGTRRTAAPLDEELRKARIYGNRTPRSRETTNSGNPSTTIRTPRTGAFERKKEPNSPPVTRRAPRTPGTIYVPPKSRSKDRKVEPDQKPAKTYIPRPTQPDRRESPPPRRSSPPPRRSSPPAKSTPRRSPPIRSTPSRPAPKRPAPRKTEPRPSKKPDPKSRPGMLN